MSNLRKTYDNLGSKELISILSNEHKYRPEAIKTAHEVLLSRGIDNESIEISVAKSEIEAKEQEVNNKPSFLQVKVGKLTDKLLEISNPVQSEKPTAEKTINHISLTFAAILILYFYKYAGLMWFYISNDYYWVDFEMFIIFFPAIYIPVSTYLFYKRKKAGWILLSIYVTVILLACIASIYQDIMWTETYSYIEDESGLMYNLNPKSNIVYGILAVILFSVILYVICKVSVRNIFKITLQTMIATIVTTILFLTIVLYKVL